MSEKYEDEKPVSKKKWGIIAVVIVVAIAVLIGAGVGIGIYNMPENRANRQLQMAYKYLQEGDYEKAALAFEQVIAVDEKCIEAYAKGIEAYIKCGNEEKQEELFGRAMERIKELDEELLTKNRKYIVDIYLTAEDIYGDMFQLTEILEDGLNYTDQDSQIKKLLVETYITIVNMQTQNKLYEDSLNILDRLLELEGKEDRVLSVLRTCLTQYISNLLELGQYDQIRELAEKYEFADSEYFEKVLKEIAERELIEIENRKFMQKVYDLMEAEDYIGMCDIGDSEDAKIFLNRMTENSFIYFPQDRFRTSGIGVGIYKVGNSYYFYYGDYVDEIRKGTGVSFKSGDRPIRYKVFIGKWDGDAPNGEGELRIEFIDDSGDNYSQVNKGNLIDGLWDGAVEWQMKTSERLFNMSFVAIKGKPAEDKTDEFYAKTGAIDRWLPKDSYVYAYGIEGSGAWAMSNCKYGESLGIFGFVESPVTD